MEVYCWHSFCVGGLAGFYWYATDRWDVGIRVKRKPLPLVIVITRFTFFFFFFSFFSFFRGKGSDKPPMGWSHLDF